MCKFSIWQTGTWPESVLLPKSGTRGFPNKKDNIDVADVFTLFQGGGGGLSHFDSAGLAQQKCPFLKKMKLLHEKTCSAIRRHIHFLCFSYLSITGYTSWKVFTRGWRVYNSVPIWETLEGFFFLNGEHFRCCVIGRHIHFLWFLYLSITGNTPWKVFITGRRVYYSVPIWKTVERVDFSLMGNILDVHLFHLADRNLTKKCVTGFPNGKQEVSQIGNTRLILMLSSPYSGGGDFSHLKSAGMA